MADVTINQSRARSLLTAGHFRNRSGVHHMCTHVMWGQYPQLERPVLVVGAKETSLLLWSRKKITKQISRPTKKSEVMCSEYATIRDNFWTKGNFREPSIYGQLDLWKANLFPMHFGKKEGFKGSKTDMSVKMVRFCKVCLSLGCVFRTALHGLWFPSTGVKSEQLHWNTSWSKMKISVSPQKLVQWTQPKVN